MAVDDIVSVIVPNAAANANSDRQPGAGIEEFVLSIGSLTQAGTPPDGIADINVYQIDGTNNDSILEQGDGGSMVTAWMTTKHVASNTNYLRFQNLGPDNSDFCYVLIVQG